MSVHFIRQRREQPDCIISPRPSSFTIPLTPTWAWPTWPRPQSRSPWVTWTCPWSSSQKYETDLQTIEHGTRSRVEWKVKSLPLSQEQEEQEQEQQPTKIFQKEVYYRSKFWHIDLTNKIKIKGQLLLWHLSLHEFSRWQFKSLAEI